MVEIGSVTESGITSVPIAKLMLGVNELTERVVSP
jgi:hypothetical protein